MLNARNSRGFTLIEIMIVVVILGIIAGIAIPQYQNYVIKATRSAAQQFLLQVANRQEQYVMDRRTYFVAANCAAFSGFGVVAPDDVCRYYGVSMTGGTTYTITATPLAGTRQAGDGTLTLNSNGQKTGPW